MKKTKVNLSFKQFFGKMSPIAAWKNPSNIYFQTQIFLIPCSHLPCLLIKAKHGKMKKEKGQKL